MKVHDDSATDTLTVILKYDAIQGMPLVGAVAAAGGFVLALSHVGPMLIGALVGGLLA